MGDFGDELIESLNEALAHARGEGPGIVHEPARVASGEEPPWMKGFGELSDLGEENRRILATIDEEFGKVASRDPK